MQAILLLFKSYHKLTTQCPILHSPSLHFFWSDFKLKRGALGTRIRLSIQNSRFERKREIGERSTKWGLGRTSSLWRSPQNQFSWAILKLLNDWFSSTHPPSPFEKLQMFLKFRTGNQLWDREVLSQLLKSHLQASLIRNSSQISGRVGWGGCPTSMLFSGGYSFWRFSHNKT